MNGTICTQTKKEIEADRKNEDFTAKLLRGEVKLIDLTPFQVSDYIKCKGKYIEKIEDRWRLAFVRCPKCNEYISIYRDEINDKGYVKSKRCLCGFKKSLILKKWKK